MAALESQLSKLFPAIFRRFTFPKNDLGLGGQLSFVFWPFLAPFSLLMSFKHIGNSEYKLTSYDWIRYKEWSLWVIEINQIIKYKFKRVGNARLQGNGFFYKCANPDLFLFIFVFSMCHNSLLNPEFHWMRQIATTLRKFHWWFWIIFWMQLPKLKN